MNNAWIQCSDIAHQHGAVAKLIQQTISSLEADAATVEQQQKQQRVAADADAAATDGTDADTANTYNQMLTTR